MRDLQKYKPWLSSKACEDWEDFVSNSKELDELCSERMQWELPVLVSAAVTYSLTRKQVSEPLSEDTVRLIAREKQVPGKVMHITN